jgi:hypothetical protein
MNIIYIPFYNSRKGGYIYLEIDYRYMNTLDVLNCRRQEGIQGYSLVSRKHKILRRKETMKNKNITYKTLESKKILVRGNTTYLLELKESSDKEKGSPVFLGVVKNTLGENNKLWVNYKPSFPLEKEFFINLEKEAQVIIKKYSSKIGSKKPNNQEEKIRLLEEKIRLLEGK